MENKLARVDLNLLLALQILLEERSVTRAAERLFVTQPAMSRMLQRLREVFDDALFTRTSKGLVPTPRAEQLKTTLAEALKKMNDVIVDVEFKPEDANGVLHIAVPEYISCSIITLLEELQLTAPNLGLRITGNLDEHMPQEECMDKLRNGSLDFSIYYSKTASDDIQSFLLDTPVNHACWMRPNHPLAGAKTLTIKSMYEYPMTVLDAPNIGESIHQQVDELLAKKSLSKHITLQTTSLSTAFELLIRSDTLMVATTDLAEYQLIKGRLIGKPLPKNMPIFQNLHHQLHLSQHERTLNSPLHSWIRERILNIAARTH
jgi:DNA-binding transcriptional LysR family regulator